MKKIILLALFPILFAAEGLAETWKDTYSVRTTYCKIDNGTHYIYRYIGGCVELSQKGTTNETLPVWVKDENEDSSINGGYRQTPLCNVKQGENYWTNDPLDYDKPPYLSGSEENFIVYIKPANN